MIEESDKYIESSRGQIVQPLCKIVGIPSEYGRPKERAPYGEESWRALGFVMDLGRKLGLEAIVSVGDRVYYIKYDIGTKVVGVSAHLDIVLGGDGWVYPPFGGEVHNNRVYSRSTIDNKGPFIASLYALYAIKERRLSLGDYRVHTISETNEEKGMDDMRYHVSQRGVPGAGFTLDGLLPMSFTKRGINYYYMSYGLSERSTLKVKVLGPHGGGTLNVAPDRTFAKPEVSGAAEADQVMKLVEEYRQTIDRDVTVRLKEDRIEIVSRGPYTHSCTPFNNKNAIMAILMLLAGLGINGSTGAFLKFFAEKIGMTTGGGFPGMKRKDEYDRLVFSLSKMDVDEKGLTWVASIRYLYTYKDQVTENFTTRVVPEGVVVHETDAHNTYRLPIGHPLIRTLRGVYGELTGKGPTPGHEGGTYARVVPDIVSFGSTSLGALDLYHRPNECIDIDEYILDVKLFGDATHALTRGDLQRQVILGGQGARVPLSTGGTD